MTGGAPPPPTGSAGGRPAGIKASVAVVFSSQALAGLVAILVPVVLTRALHQSDYGLYKQFQLLYQTLMVLAAAGFPDALVYFLARERGRPQDVVASVGVQVAATLTLVTIVLVVWGDRLIAFLASDQLVPFAPWVVLAVAAFTVGEIFLLSISAQKRFFLYAALNTSFVVGQALLVVLVALAVGELRGVLAAVLAAGAVKMLLGLAWLGRMVWRGRGRVTREAVGRQLGYGLPMGGAAILKKLNDQLHRYLITASLNPASFAIYSIATIKLPLVRLLRGSVVRVFQPHFASMEQEQRHLEILGLWHGSIRRLSLVYLPVVAALIGFAPELITLVFPDEYAGAVPVFRVFTIMLAFESFGGVEAILKAFAQTRFLLTVDGARLAIGTLLGWYLLGRVGLVGPAAAVSATAILAMAVRMARIRTLMGVSPRRLLPWSHVAGVAVSALGAFLVARAAVGLVPDDRLLVLLVGLPVFAAVYAAAVLLSGLVPKTDRATLLRALRRRGRS